MGWGGSLSLTSFDLVGWGRITILLQLFHTKHVKHDLMTGLMFADLVISFVPL